MTKPQAPETVTVNREALIQLLNAFAGPMYLVNELWAIQRLESPANPLTILRKEVSK